jgi:hypothetical protein
MNVQDVKVPEVQGDKLRAIFQRQEQLMLVYHDIERRNGLGLGAIPPGKLLSPGSLDDPQVQYLMKDYAWRVTEELTEATELDQGYRLHRQEETVDALHFLVELLLIAGLGRDDLVAPLETEGKDPLDFLFGERKPPAGEWDSPFVDLCAYTVVERLGQAMNCLKNKPWKQTQMETDRRRFRDRLAAAFVAWVYFAGAVGLDADLTVDLYLRKAEVNSFRQRSNY